MVTWRSNTWHQFLINWLLMPRVLMTSCDDRLCSWQICHSLLGHLGDIKMSSFGRIKSLLHVKRCLVLCMCCSTGCKLGCARKVSLGAAGNSRDVGSCNGWHKPIVGSLNVTLTLRFFLILMLQFMAGLYVISMALSLHTVRKNWKAFIQSDCVRLLDSLRL